MVVKGIIFEDFINYKKPCMTLETCYCSFKCDKEFGIKICQNGELIHQKNIEIENDRIVSMYLNNPITEALCFQGLEPFDSYLDVYKIIELLRIKYDNHDPIVIYSGYTKKELEDMHYLTSLKKFDKIIIKYGRYIPNQEKHYDKILGVYLASSNQYAEELK